MRLTLTAIAVLALASCAQGNIELTSPTGEVARVQFTRVGTDTGFSMGPDGTLTYSSNPSAIAQQQALQGTMDALKLGLMLASTNPTLPAKLLSSGEAR